MKGIAELPYPKWQGPLKEVVLEFDREKLFEKALEAENLILERLRQLEESRNSHSERRAIGDGLSLLETIKRERLSTSCKSCGSVNQGKFSAEMGIHFLGLKNIDKPVVWVFPELVVCLDCGTAEFAVPEEELRQLAKGNAAAAG
jgi:hypothetical protein